MNVVGNRRNWHALNWETDEQIGRKRSVDKRGAKSDEAYVRDVLDEKAPFSSAVAATAAPAG